MQVAVRQTQAGVKKCSLPQEEQAPGKEGRSLPTSTARGTCLWGLHPSLGQQASPRLQLAVWPRGSRSRCPLSSKLGLGPWRVDACPLGDQVGAGGMSPLQPPQATSPQGTEILGRQLHLGDEGTAEKHPIYVDLNTCPLGPPVPSQALSWWVLVPPHPTPCI